MYTLVIDRNPEDTRKIRRASLIYLLCGISLAGFAIIYEIFSHNVLSLHMVYACMYPIVLGTLFFDYKIYDKRPFFFGWVTYTLYNCGVITLSVGSVVKGIFDIFGSGNKFISVYYVIGFLLIITASVLYLFAKKKLIERDR